MKIKCELSKVCEEKKTTITELSKIVNIHRNVLYNYAGDRFIPNLTTALLIANTLGTKVESIWIVDNLCIKTLDK